MPFEVSTATGEQSVEVLRRELAEALEYQAALSEVLGVIASSPGELQSALDVIVETAARLCRADRATMWRRHGDSYRLAAMVPEDGDVRAYLDANPIAPGPNSTIGRTLLAKATVHVPDVANVGEPRYAHATPGPQLRAMLGVPLLRGGELIGILGLSRFSPNPYSEKQIALVEAFARQAVIAIENARLFDEVQTRTFELTESLEYQTAISEVLSVISRSPTDIQPVFDMIAQSAARLCKAEFGHVFRYDGTLIHFAAVHGLTPEGR